MPRPNPRPWPPAEDLHQHMVSLLGWHETERRLKAEAQAAYLPHTHPYVIRSAYCNLQAERGPLPPTNQEGLLP